jgi:hypothetical protein
MAQQGIIVQPETFHDLENCQYVRIGYKRCTYPVCSFCDEDLPQTTVRIHLSADHRNDEFEAMAGGTGCCLVESMVSDRDIDYILGFTSCTIFSKVILHVRARLARD